MPKRELGAVLVALATVSLVACSDSPSAPSTPGPPPLNPLGWNDVPERMALYVGDETSITILLTAAVEAEYSVTAQGETVKATGAATRTGVFELTVSALTEGETTVEVVARAPGYTPATASIPVVVSALQPLDWLNLPDRLEMYVGDTEDLELRLTSIVDAEYEVTSTTAGVVVATGTPRGNGFMVRISAVREGETESTWRRGLLPISGDRDNPGAGGTASAELAPFPR